ncbi:AAA family ATPase [Streptomyces cupreus]|uniref:ATP-binding protein n=1 Tax=Streptomyces cupreus TaxID=2759956 RepID=A0A7X1MCX6_9ACTN|nr:ATP-binding protein [Streptomyces cupreus]MBC2906909.1 ATP-binding protein [Streptomyces cupreus]
MNNHTVGAREVLTLGLAVDTKDEEGLAPLDALDPLVEAPSHAARIAKVLQDFGYRLRSPRDLATDPGRHIRQAVTSADTSVLVVHVVGHGRLAEAGERGLHVVGADGENLDDPVSAWISLIESHPERSRPLTLFLLDLCHAGIAATLPWHQRMPTARRRAWVIAACGPQDEAFDYRLSKAAYSVLNRYLDGELRVSSSYAHIPLPTIAREISRAVTDLSIAEGFSQQIDVSRVPFTDLVEDLPFFPNPRHRARRSTLPGLEAGISSLLDEAFDPDHFMLRAAGAQLLGRGLERGYFRGRKSQVHALTRWLNGHGSGFGLLTGKPGSGKSALLGVLMSAAHPDLRDVTDQLWRRLDTAPARNARLAVVHGRRRDLTQIAGSLARQLGAAEPDRPSGWDADGLSRLVGRRGNPPCTFVIDAVDEAERPADVAQALLQPLARVALSGDTPLRLLVGTRQRPEFTTLTSMAKDAGQFVSLDDTPPEELYEDLRQYVGDLLAMETGYRDLVAAEAVAALAEGIAARLTGVNDPDAEKAQGPLEWGEFLVSGLYVRALLGGRVEVDPAVARTIGLAVPRDLPALLDLDLAGLPDRHHVRSVLRALAHAESQGMPERVLAHVATAFAEPGTPASPLPLDQVRQALDAARFYLRSDVDVDGTTLFRLFHEGLAERLRTEPIGSADGAS